MYIKSQINKLPLSLWLAEESFQQYLSAPNTSRGFNPLEESFFFFIIIFESKDQENAWKPIWKLKCLLQKKKKSFLC